MKTLQEIEKEVKQQLIEFEKTTKKYINHLSEPIQKVILEWFSEENWNSTEEAKVIKGFAPQNEYVVAALLGCKDNQNLGCYNGCAFNDKEKLIFNFAEGDISLSICKNEKSYQDKKIETIKFYENN